MMVDVEVKLETDRAAINHRPDPSVGTEITIEVEGITIGTTTDPITEMGQGTTIGMMVEETTIDRIIGETITGLMIGKTVTDKMVGETLIDKKIERTILEIEKIMEITLNKDIEIPEIVIVTIQEIGVEIE